MAAMHDVATHTERFGPIHDSWALDAPCGVWDEALGEGSESLEAEDADAGSGLIMGLTF